MNIDQLAHDRIVFGVMHGTLLLVWLVAVSKDGWAWGKFRFGTGTRAKGTALRGEPSMNFLVGVYGVATVVCALSVQVAEAFCGYKVFFILLDYVILTYLFFFNSWFRNRLLTIQGRTKRD